MNTLPQHSQSVLVTGSSSGFGREICLGLAQRGLRVYATMRDPQGRNAAAADALTALAEQEAMDLHVLALDVTSDESVSACASETAQSGGVDVVVQNAGVAAAGLMDTFSAAVAQAMFDVNVFGPHRVLRAFLPQLFQSSYGHVVYVSSTDGREVMPFLGLYNASKAALEALAESWSYELNPLGVRTTIIQPGTFPTTRILDNLLAADAPERAEQLGPVADAPNQLFAGITQMIEAGQAPDPGLVAEAVVTAVLTPGAMRVPLDPSGFDGAARINATAADVQGELLARFGMSHLLTLETDS